MTSTMVLWRCGHERSPENTYPKRADGKGPRRCAMCVRRMVKESRARKTAGAPMRADRAQARAVCKNGHDLTGDNHYRPSEKPNAKRCRQCRTEYMAWYYRTWKLRAKYGLSRQEYADMLVSQDGLCAICYEDLATEVDHDHQTGLVRGLLCGKCNKALGLFNDDAQRALDAAAYLKGGSR